jgi:predicted ester cyclase
MTTTDANKQLVRDYFTAFLKSDEGWWAKHIAPTFRRHDPGLPFEVVGPEGVKKLAEALHPGIPDMELPIEDLVAEGEKVLARLRVKGTHRGDLMGVPATGKTIDIAVLDLFQIRDAKLVEHWALLDNLGLLRQIGVTNI